MARPFGRYQYVDAAARYQHSRGAVEAPRRGRRDEDDAPPERDDDEREDEDEGGKPARMPTRSERVSPPKG